LKSKERLERDGNCNGTDWKQNEKKVVVSERAEEKMDSFCSTIEKKKKKKEQKSHKNFSTNDRTRRCR